MCHDAVPHSYCDARLLTSCRMVARYEMAEGNVDERSPFGILFMISECCAGCVEVFATDLALSFIKAPHAFESFLTSGVLM